MRLNVPFQTLSPFRPVYYLKSPWGIKWKHEYARKPSVWQRNRTCFGRLFAYILYVDLQVMLFCKWIRWANEQPDMRSRGVLTFHYLGGHCWEKQKLNDLSTGQLISHQIFVIMFAMESFQPDWTRLL